MTAMVAIPRFAPVGPVSARFLGSRRRWQLMMGPFGSAKTSHALMKLVYVGIGQAPHPVDRVRRTKFAVIRSTYRELEKTTLPSWRRWFPKSFPESEWHGGAGGQPAEHILRFQLKDGTTAEITLQFIAVGEQSVEDVARGLEITGALLEEFDLLPFSLLAWLDGRVGRYPAADPAVGFEGATWCGILGTFNAPDLEHELYKLCAEGVNPATGLPLPEGLLDFFEQPGGLVELRKGEYAPNPKAENLANLPKNYYQNMIGAMPYWQLRRMVLNKWGASRDGAPVYPEYDDELHCPATELEPIAGLALEVGLDSSGLHGAAVITQRTSLGQRRVLDELVSPQSGMGASEFARLFVMLLQSPRYAAWLRNFGRPPEPSRPAIVVTYDPADSKDSDGKSWVTLFSAVVKRAAISIRFQKAPTNRLTPRIEAVRRPLTQSHGQPDFQINRRCVVTRRGFNSGYRLKRVQIAGSERYQEEPEKNDCSHPHDALQYVMLSGGEYRVIMDGGDEAHRARRHDANPTQAEEYRPF
jgi:hypothetical protein